MRTLSQMGLTTWDQADDNYDYQQLANNWNLVNFHDHTPSRGVPIPAGGLAPGAVLSQNIAAGVIGSQHFSTILAEDLGVGGTGRGYTGVSTNQTTTSSTFTYMPTADLVTGLSMASNGLILMDYQALVSGNGQAQVVLNGSPIPYAGANVAPNAGTLTFNSTNLAPIVTIPLGLTYVASGSSNSSESSTGQILGVASVSNSDTIRIWVPAGTYSVGVQYLSLTSTVHVSNRHLWVRTENFA